MYNDYPATYFPINSVHEQLLFFFTDAHPIASIQDAQDYVTRLEQVDTKFEQLFAGLDLREEMGIEQDDSMNPRNEIARYIVWPGQSTAYMVGMLKILELRQLAMDRLGDQFDIKEFHNVVLTNGSMPLAVLEQAIDNYIQDKLASAELSRVRSHH